MYDNIDGDNVGDYDSDIIYMAPSQKPWVIDISNEGWYSTIIPSTFSSSMQLLSKFSLFQSQRSIIAHFEWCWGIKLILHTSE